MPWDIQRSFGLIRIHTDNPLDQLSNSSYVRSTILGDEIESKLNLTSISHLAACTPKEEDPASV